MMSTKRVVHIVGVVVTLFCALELAGFHLHAPHWWPLPFGYNAFFGFVGAWALILMSKVVMASLLQRDSDYYDKEENKK